MKKFLKNIWLWLLTILTLILILSFYISVDTCDKYPNPDCLDHFTPVLFHWFGWY